MRVFLFQDRFAGKVRDGSKPHTIRKAARRLRSVVRPCRRCHGTGRVWGGWDFWGHRQHPCPACRYEKWITGFVYAPRKRRPNVPVRRGSEPSRPAAGSAICEATTTARRGDDDCGKWRRCELPAGHTGEHKTTYCGHDYCWPNAGGEA